MFLYFLFISVIPVTYSFGFSDLGFFSSSESCDRTWVPQNIYGLERNLNSFVFGQHLVTEVVIAALQSHLSKTHRKKPLVLSFHGSPGCGKGFVASHIVTNWFREGEKSMFVKSYKAKLHFPRKDRVYEYQKQLQNDLEETISRCPKAMFVFDEVDKYPPHVLDGIKPYLDYSSYVNGHDFREAIFIFITNNGQEAINQLTLQKRRQYFTREELKLRDFEKIILTTSFNNEGGFFRSDLIRHVLIDHVVPFLPLEREHVQSCIKAETIKQNGPTSYLEDVLSEVMEQLTFKEEIYSSNGCKGISEKVSFIIERERWKKNRRKQIEF